MHKNTDTWGMNIVAHSGAWIQWHTMGYGYVQWHTMGHECSGTQWGMNAVAHNGA